MKLETPIYSGSLVKWNGNQGVTDCTTLRVDRDKLPFGHMFDNNTTLGLRIKSHKTGVTKEFVLSKVERNDFDHLAWSFESVDKTLKLVVFDD